MTTQIGASVFVDPAEIRHDITNGNPTITFGPYPTVRRLDLHLGDVATIDAVITHLVALKQEMDPPVISEAQLAAALISVSDRLPIENLAPHVLAKRLLLAAQEPVTDSERTCPAVNDGWHCHVKGEHDEHEDDNGERWRTDGAQPCTRCGEPVDAPVDELCAACAEPAPSGAQGTAAEMAQVSA